MHRGLSVAVVVPAFNEERLLETTIHSIPDWVDRVIVVDDASEDGTARVALDAAGDRPGFELLGHEQNLGVGAAICSGYRRALELDVDAVVVMGADAQMAPEDLPPLLAPLVEGRADYSKGDRLHWPGVARIMPRMRWLGNWGLTWLTRPVSGYWSLSDSQCGYTAISRKALTLLPLDHLYPRYGYPNDLLARLNALGLRVVDVVVRPIYGPEESGIRLARVVPSMLALLLRSLASRLYCKWRSGREANERAAGEDHERYAASEATARQREGLPG